MPKEQVWNRLLNFNLTPSKRLWISPENEAYFARPAPSLRVKSSSAWSNSEHWVWSSATKLGDSVRTVAVWKLWSRKESAEWERWEGGGSGWRRFIGEFRSWWLLKVFRRRVRCSPV